MIFRRLRCFYNQKRFLLFTITLTLIFLMYQIISVGQLGKELSRRNPRSKLQKNFRSYEKADGFMQVKNLDELKRNTDETWHSQKIIHDGMRNILGVLPENQKYYMPTTGGTFKCIHSGEEISYSLVNDDFCDCSDFTDEPSTSACNYGRFYCSHHSKHFPTFIISYKVNDGICDCCDGSDEWEPIKLPRHTKVTGQKLKGIHQQPCPVRCIL
ncbi:uncharacterized protein LOC129235228 [Uloborus diversus]|uniref:uncharacterized protein LOC129235228 n=1 Tax=Uloborus diversus TaxID=327109 RepID=UPI0024090224|nr:uncharacterized protein LOC129235228 [Uloborus diversus]